MVRLSAHLQYSAHVLSTSRAGSLCSLPTGGATRDWGIRRRVKRLSVECTLEKKKLGFTDGCASRKERSGVHCSRVAEAWPWSAKDLEERFGQAGVKFVEAAGYRIVEMRLNEGSSVRIVLQSALVASYKSGMWHGGVEELLYTAVVPGMERPTTVGGVALRVWEAESGSGSNLALTECWDVENVRSNPSQFVQVWIKFSRADYNIRNLEDFSELAIIPSLRFM